MKYVIYSIKEDANPKKWYLTSIQLEHPRNHYWYHYDIKDAIVFDSIEAASECLVKIVRFRSKGNYFAWEDCGIEEYQERYRQLIRVTALEKDGCMVVIPGWSNNVWIKLKVESLPHRIQSLLAVGKRFHAMVNISVTDPNDLVFTDWEEE